MVCSATALRFCQSFFFRLQMTARCHIWRPLAAATIASLFLLGATAQAQSPSETTPSAVRAQRARDACDAVASRYGYHVVRRDSLRTKGGTYELPFHVTHGTAETDVTCRYDIKRGVAELPRWDAHTGQPVHSDGGDTGHRTNGMSRDAFIARQECENYINSRPGFRVQRIGTPVALALGQWDVPLTARQDGHTDVRAMCRYTRATGTVSLRPR